MSSTTTEQQQQSTLSVSPSISRQSSPPSELRRITSNTNIATPRDSNREHRLSARQSQLLQTAPRLGSRSPASIPSSPTSVHSSSSAIFERDIEPLTPSPPSHPQNPHLIPRSKGTEAIEQSVPSVLDSAAAVLTSTSPEDEDFVAVVAPAPEIVSGYASGFTSPIESGRSRSPSPGASANRTSLLLSLPSPPPSHARPLYGTSSVNGPSSPIRPSVQTQPQQRSEVHTPSDGPQPLSTPTSAYFSVASLSSAGSSPTTTTVEHPSDTLHTPTSSAVSPAETHNTLASATSPSAAALSATNSTGISHPPSPKSNAAKRLSFMSYSDLLSSTPASTLPLSSLTSSAMVNDPPPHIPTVSGFTQTQSQAHSAASSIHHGVAAGLAQMKEGPLDPILLEDDGGEWEREGLGKGLEERLEALMTASGKA
ncbi:hypothetical protein GLOTRDRAFT_118045 [Gloeophyllum trabeum ATCC 11539]|uniref:Uncharacterized protein n=1 Tax=Gloeophyllum trabeum (strain ATCC 11539 / FP-39264 / Madison 617) TaxID=670483 RepID=S7PV51_GLOTA|nr:uncharacterized protein GLOTRDRAFT_118045 [Gloeophyllum trabeum ATCC 11539]EPQ51408.1 hypothetical protein GLOTRDRAFT_118045 [Gloeophyllum trabeum ATCC 11539]